MTGAKKPAPQAPAKKHFGVRLIPPRPTFAADMTEEERAIMAAHGVGILEAKEPDAARGLAGTR